MIRLSQRDNFDYDVIPNWVDGVGIEENKRKERKSRIDIILETAFLGVVWNVFHKENSQV